MRRRSKEEDRRLTLEEDTLVRQVPLQEGVYRVPEERVWPAGIYRLVLNQVAMTARLVNDSEADEEEW